ncbi:MAG: hypothetical protein M1816_000840 [Peltula sp. TS41687]|nr:MAG: hypothetical protein M1816_000840 [Peltula sp. TS41687]
MSSIPSSDVYTGQWTNWSNGGRVLGSTITTKTTTAAAVVAFLALFIQISGSHLWDLFCFFIYHCRSRKKLHEALYSQQQILLRNNPSPFASALEYLKLGWHWRRRSDHALLPNILLAGYGIVFAVALGATAIFSSFVITSTDIEVLTKSSSCGYWPTIKNGDVPLQDESATVPQNQRWSQILASSSTYSRACYNSSRESSSPQCRVYSSPRPHWTTDSNAACPFSSAICMGSNNSAIRIDTGSQDVSQTFGVNAPNKGRIYFRKVTTCAPLLTDDHYVNKTNMSSMTRSAYPGEEAILFNYGPAIKFRINSTWLSSSITMNKTRAYTKAALRHYLNGERYSDFVPRPELIRSDADHTVVFISMNSVLAAEPIDDPIFSAHRPIVTLASNRNSGIFYGADRPAGVIGCIEQYQFCNPNMHELRGCTPLTGIVEATELARTTTNLNPFQSATMDRLRDAILNWSCGIAIAGYDQAGLLAERQVITSTQLPLPRNHWQVEVEDWHGTVFAAIQRFMVEHTIGPDDAAWLKYLQKPNTTAELAMCHTQKVRVGSNFSNINVFGLAFIIALGGLIILTNLVLRNVIVRLLARRPNCQSGMAVPWLQDGLLQVQRIAYQACGEGTWEGLGDTVPVTKRGELLRNLWDLSESSSSQGSLKEGSSLKEAEG